MGGYDRVKSHHYNFDEIDFNSDVDGFKTMFNKIRKNTVEEKLGINQSKILFTPHFILHHYHAYYSNNCRDINNRVIFHQEGDGGEYNAGISIPTNKGLKWLEGTNQSDIGRLYQWTTLNLGMKPYHHEYKLMGLAPYATQSEVEKSYSVIKDIFKIDKELMSIVYNNKPSDLYFYFRDKFRGQRFDGIAGAIQKLVEELLNEQLTSIIKKTKRSKISYGGGTAMNVKANGLLASREDVNDFFVPISPGDESNPIGACYYATEKYFLENNIDPNQIPPLDNIYLGPEYSDIEVKKFVSNIDLDNKINVYENIDASFISKKLHKGNVMGRFVGRSEFGQRSLGNRSIIASTTENNIVDKINSKIKYRDFWMPFCPTILDKHKNEYIHNPKNLKSEYMTLSFNLNKKYEEYFKGGVHHADKTVRPQILENNKNNEYYKLIDSFEKFSGLGSIINTSFNLHGEPVVGTLDDAIRTFNKSDLDGLVLNNIYLEKNESLKK